MLVYDLPDRLLSLRLCPCLNTAALAPKLVSQEFHVTNSLTAPYPLYCYCDYASSSNVLSLHPPLNIVIIAYPNLTLASLFLLSHTVLLQHDIPRHTALTVPTPPLTR